MRLHVSNFWLTLYLLLIILITGCGDKEKSDCRTEAGKCTDGFICQIAESGAYECVPESNPMGGDPNSNNGGQDGESDPVDTMGGQSIGGEEGGSDPINPTGGEESGSNSVDPVDPTGGQSEYTGPRKKGIVIHISTYDWSEKVAAVKPFWSYSWGHIKSRFQPDGVEFVPMIWSGSISEEKDEYLRTQFAAGEIKYLLGYNEPDGERQANMSVDRALELWPQLESIGIPLVSPSPVHYDNEWMIEFMRRANEANLRIDYLAFHWYGGTDPQWFLDLLDRVYERYQLPIWITEFAPADWNTDSRENNRMRPEQVYNFMQTVLPELDRRDYIIRYAWYSDYSSKNLWTSALYDEEGNLTRLGELYAEHSANPEAGPGKPYPVPNPDPDNLIKNGGFDLENTEDWEGYEKSFPSIEYAEPHEGAFCAKLRGGYSSAISQKVRLESGRTYRVSVHGRWSETPSRFASAALEKEGGTEVVFGPAFEDTNWQQSSFTYTATETTDHVFWIWTDEGVAADLYIDTVSIRLEE